MIWKRTLLDAIAMAAYFNLFAALVVIINPRVMMCSYPKSIQKAAPAPQTRRERRLYHLWMYFGMLLPLEVYGSASAVCDGVSGFWPLLLMGYIEWLAVSLTDFFLLDVCLLQRLGRRIQVPGTEGHPDYRLGSWLKKLALRSIFWHGRWRWLRWFAGSSRAWDALDSHFLRREGYEDSGVWRGGAGRQSGP